MAFVTLANVNLRKEFNEKFESGEFTPEQRLFLEEALDNLTITVDEYHTKEFVVNGKEPQASESNGKKYLNINSMPTIYNRMKMDEDEANSRLEKDDQFGKIAQISIAVVD